MFHNNSIKVMVVMQVGARRRCRRADNMMQNNIDNANGDACTTD